MSLCVCAHGSIPQADNHCLSLPLSRWKSVPDSAEVFLPPQGKRHGLGRGVLRVRVRACAYFHAIHTVGVIELSLTRFLRAISVRQSKGSHSQIRLTLLLSSIYSSHYIASPTCSPQMLLLPILRVSLFIWFLSFAKIKHAVSLLSFAVVVKTRFLLFMSCAYMQKNSEHF